eukprot:m51a1_g2307 hypothetical protein (354) ;mRNA; r:454318-455718
MDYPDVLTLVFRHLDVASLATARAVCRLWRDVACAAVLWLPIARRLASDAQLADLCGTPLAGVTAANARDTAVALYRASRVGVAVFQGELAVVFAHSGEEVLVMPVAMTPVGPDQVQRVCKAKVAPLPPALEQLQAPLAGIYRNYRGAATALKRMGLGATKDRGVALLNEIYMSELAYVKMMLTAIVAFVTPARNALRSFSRKGPLKNHMVRSFFDSYEHIARLHCTFAQEMGEYIEDSWEIAGTAGFSHMIARHFGDNELKAHMLACCSLWNPVQQLLSKKASKWESMRTNVHLPAYEQLSCAAFAVLPIARVPRYLLFMKEAVKQHYVGAEEAVDVCSEFCTQANQIHRPR